MRALARRRHGERYPLCCHQQLIDGTRLLDIELEAEARVERARAEVEPWRAMIADLLGLAPYDAKILTLNDARARLRGAVR